MWTPVEDELDHRFSFHGVRAYGNWQTEIDEAITQARVKRKIDPLMIDALERGVGMHYEGLSKAYRDLVVRISGYSAYFRDLTPPMQDEIIARHEHAD